MSEKSAAEQSKIPRSLAIIMDGNGRWARKRGLGRIKGHEHGITAVRETVEECARLGVEALTLYAFSEENWSRPKKEISLLMKLLERFLVEERPTLQKNNVRLVHAGRVERLEGKVLKLLQETIDLTAANTGMTLCLAISYGARAELVDAMRNIASKVAAGELRPEDIEEKTISAQLYQPNLPDPDLLIRTADEMRLSNFLLWQISYTEFYVTPVCWPDFRKEHLQEAFASYAARVRKFGAVLP
ncbi:MAG: isoprenyl transferase [Planctomycetota bacterium]